MSKVRPVAERFNEKVDRSGGADACWPWLGKTRLGYGSFFISTATRPHKTQAHRVAWALARGDDARGAPRDMKVCHSCDNPPCCNPKHLWLGTNADNLADMRSKGRGSVPVAGLGEANARSRLTADQVREIRASTDTLSNLAKSYGVSRTTVGLARRGSSWATVVEKPSTTPVKGRPRGEENRFSILTDAIVVEMRDRHRAGESIAALALEHAVSEPCASKAIRGKTWVQRTTGRYPRRSR